MKLYRVEVKLAATAYIKANNEAEAMRAAKNLSGAYIEAADAGGELEISGLAYSDPRLPLTSLSPAMTCHGVWDEEDIEEMHDYAHS